MNNKSYLVQVDLQSMPLYTFEKKAKSFMDKANLKAYRDAIELYPVTTNNAKEDLKNAEKRQAQILEWLAPFAQAIETERQRVTEEVQKPLNGDIWTSILAEAHNNRTAQQRMDDDFAILEETRNAIHDCKQIDDDGVENHFDDRVFKVTGGKYDPVKQAWIGGEIVPINPEPTPIAWKDRARRYNPDLKDTFKGTSKAEKPDKYSRFELAPEYTGKGAVPVQASIISGGYWEYPSTTISRKKTGAKLEKAIIDYFASLPTIRGFINVYKTGYVFRPKMDKNKNRVKTYIQGKRYFVYQLEISKLDIQEVDGRRKIVDMKETEIKEIYIEIKRGRK